MKKWRRWKYEGEEKEKIHGRNGRTRGTKQRHCYKIIKTLNFLKFRKDQRRPNRNTGGPELRNLLNILFHFILPLFVLRGKGEGGRVGLKRKWWVLALPPVSLQGIGSLSPRVEPFK